MPENDTVRVNVSPEIAEMVEREARRGVRWRNGPVACLGLLGFIGGVAFFIDPTGVNDSAIGRNLPGPWDELWSAAWTLGGLLVIVGALWPTPLVELFGWAVYVPAMFVYSVAVLMLTGGAPPAAYLAFSIGAAGAAKMVYLQVYAPRATRVRVERRHPDAARYGGRERRG
jgi:hypothetical protein